MSSVAMPRSDETRQEVAAAPVRVQADAQEGEADGRALAGDAQVAREREARAGAGGDAVDGGDDGLRHRRSADDLAHRRTSASKRAMSSVSSSSLHDLDVAAGGERAAGTGDDDAAHLVVGLELLRARWSRSSRIVPDERVQPFGPVDADPADGAVALDQEWRRSCGFHLHDGRDALADADAHGREAVAAARRRSSCTAW
jgi:hypothetical protein